MFAIDEGVNYDVHDCTSRPPSSWGSNLGLHASHTGEDIAEEEMFSADEQPDFEEASQEAPDVDMTYFQDSF